MDFTFSETQLAVRELARRVFKEHPLDAWPQLASSGLLGTALPEEVGGSGHGLLELGVLFEEAGAAAQPSPLLPATAAALAIAQFGPAELQRRLLPGLLDGEILLSAALERPTSEGVADFVPWAHEAARVLVATSDGLLLVDPREARLEPQHPTTGEPQARMTFNGGERLGDAAALEWIRDRALALQCAAAIGLTERALRMTAEYTSTRHQFDRPIATFQAVSQRAADAFIDVETIRLSTWRALWLLSEDRPATHALSVAKLFAAEGGHRVVYAAQHLHAGIGFDRDYPLHRYYLWSKQLELSLGPASAHLEKLGAELARR